MKKETLKPVRELNPAVPEFVDLAIQRALALEQDMRFPDIESFRLGIQGQLSSATILSSQPPPPDKPKRSTWWISAAAAGVVVIIGGALLLLRSGIFSGDEASDLPTATIQLVYSVASGGTEPPAIDSGTPSPTPHRDSSVRHTFAPAIPHRCTSIHRGRRTHRLCQRP